MKAPTRDQFGEYNEYVKAITEWGKLYPEARIERIKERNREYIRNAKRKMRGNPTKRHLEKERRKELKKMRFGMRAAKCEVCDKECYTQLDHDHKTQIARGWLCNGCNSALGHVRDSTNTLNKLILYVEYWDQRNASHEDHKQFKIRNR